jgi:hypothetical protein
MALAYPLPERAADLVGHAKLMTTVLSLLLPTVLGVYCIWQALRRPIFLLGIPFLQVMEASVFFRNVKPFWIPGRLGSNYLLLLWLALAWVWSAYRSTDREPNAGRQAIRHAGRLLPEEHLLLALAVLVLAKLLWSDGRHAGAPMLLEQFAPWGLLLAGYWLIRGIVRRASSEDTAALLLFVAVATGIGSALFILHQGLRVPIYHGSEYRAFEFEGQALSRTFWFMPPFLLFSLGFALARRSWSAGTVVLTVLTMVAVVVSYTRSLVVAAAAAVGAVLGLRLLKERRPGLLARRLSILGAVLAITVATLLVALPGPTSYFLNRLATLTNASMVIEDPNALSRQSDLLAVGDVVYDRYALIGAPFGAVDDTTEKATEYPDSTWVGVLYWTGYLGAAVVAAMFALFTLRAVRLFLGSRGTAEMLGAAYAASMLAILVTTFTDWTFLHESRYAMGLWLFAFIAGEATKIRRLSSDSDGFANARIGHVS